MNTKTNRKKLRDLHFERMEPRLLLTARLFADVEAANIGSNPAVFTKLGDQVIFVAQDSQPRNDGSGFQLYVTDGTADSTIAIHRFDDRRLAEDFEVVEDAAFFSTTGPHGESQELWKTDGTVGGTQMVRPLAELSQNRASDFVAVGDQLFYAHGSGPNQGMWRTDGDEAVLLTDAVGRLEDPVVVDDVLFFKSIDEVHGRELWKSDGTAEGTQLVKDIFPGEDSSGIKYPQQLGNQLLFFANDGQTGVELWQSDGTEEGTRVVKDLVPGQDGRQPAGLFPYWSVAGDEVMFFSAAGGETGREIYRTDGTSEGTFLLRDINEGVFGSDPFPIAIAGDQLLFNSFVNGRELWTTDGTSDGTRPFERVESGWSWSPDEVTVLNQSIYISVGDQNGFLASYTAEDGRDILGFDPGTPAGAQPLLGPDGDYSSWLDGPRHYVEIGGQVVYSANDGLNGSELWKTDGTYVGTSLLKNIANPGSFGSDPIYVTEIDGMVYFTARANGGPNNFLGREIWLSDGTPDGTRLLKDLTTGNNEQDAAVDPNFTKLGTSVIFMARSDAGDYELWKTDGTEDGTVLVRDIRVGPESSFPDLDSRIPRFTVLGDEAYFVANDGRGNNLWKTDGTEEGTQLVHRLRRDRVNPNIREVTAFRGEVFYAADDGINGTELWKTTGVPGAAELVTRVPGLNGAGPSQLTVLGDRLFFTARELDTNREKLWSSDGTREGTQVLESSFLDPPEQLTVVGDKLFFMVETSSNYELWVTDASLQVQFLRRLERRSEAIYLTAVEDQLYFFENMNGNSTRLWTSDGTPIGTVPGLTWENALGVRSAYAAGAKLAFEAGDRDQVTLWLSDGTPERTSEIGGLSIFQSFSHRRVTDVADSTIYLAADDGVSGNEVWSVDWQNPPVPQIAEIVTNGGAGDVHRLESISARFTHDVSASLSFGALTIVDATSLLPIPVSGTVEWDPETLTATWLYAKDLGPGKYRVTVDSQTIQNESGDLLDGNHDFVGGDDHTFEFVTYLAGDTNLDGAVKFDDFLLFSSNFGMEVESSVEGDFDGDGTVGFADFLVLSKNFGQQQGD